jgi:hypothetical protein
LFPFAFLQESFVDMLGMLEFEEARLFIIFLRGSLCFSVFDYPMNLCLFCNNHLSSAHFFNCPSLRGFLSRCGVTLQLFFELGRDQMWEPLFSLFLLCFGRGSACQGIFAQAQRRLFTLVTF